MGYWAPTPAIKSTAIFTAELIEKGEGFMSVLKKTFKTTLKWFGIFLAITVFVPIFTFYRIGGSAAANKLIGLVGATVILTTIVFMYSLISNLFSKIPQKKSRIYEEQLYAKVAKEMASGYIRNGLWAKAFSQSKGSEDVARSIYIKLRVQSLEDEINLKQGAVDIPVVSWPAAQQKATSQVVKKQALEKTEKLYDLGKLNAIDASLASWNAQQGVFIEKDTQEITPLQSAVKKTVKPCDLSQLKSSIMRDESDNVRKVFMNYETEEYEQYLPELLELADLFDANESRDFLLCHQKIK